MFIFKLKGFDFPVEPVNGKNDECIEIFPTDNQIKGKTSNNHDEMGFMNFGDNHKINHVQVDEILNQLTNESNEISCAEQNHSDLVAGIYEGIVNHMSSNRI